MTFIDLIKQLGKTLRATSTPPPGQPSPESTPIAGKAEGPAERDGR